MITEQNPHKAANAIASTGNLTKTEPSLLPNKQARILPGIITSILEQTALKYWTSPSTVDTSGLSFEHRRTYYGFTTTQEHDSNALPRQMNSKRLLPTTSRPLIYLYQRYCYAFNPLKYITYIRILTICNNKAFEVISFMTDPMQTC